MPRPVHAQTATPAEQRAWKKVACRVNAPATALPASQVPTLGEDEARLGLKPVVRRVWARKGKHHRPACSGASRGLPVANCTASCVEDRATEWLVPRDRRPHPGHKRGAQGVRTGRGRKCQTRAEASSAHDHYVRLLPKFGAGSSWHIMALKSCVKDQPRSQSAMGRPPIRRRLPERRRWPLAVR